MIGIAGVLPSRRWTVAVLLVSGIASVPARASGIERARFLMGTTCRIAAEHPEPSSTAPAIEAAFDEIARWQSILSDYDRDSELSRVNASAGAAPVPCSRDLYAFLSTSLDLAAKTNGAFDITVGPIVDLYAIRSGGRWPAGSEVTAAMGRTGWRRLLLDDAAGTARFLSQGMRLDPGAIGKGYALDAAARVLRERGVRWALLDFGGQILDVGGGPDGRGTQVAIAVEGRAAPARRLIRIRDASASTSANDEKGLLVEGRPMGHIFDPRTGRPVEGMRSVTAVASTGTLADALSTALFVLGPGEGGEVAKRFGAQALFTTEGPSGTEVVATEGFDRLAPPPRSASELEERVAALEARVAELRPSRGSAAAPDAAELERRLDVLAAELEKIRLGEAAAAKPLEPAHGLGPAAAKVYGVAKGVSIGGYGEAIYDNVGARDQSGAPSGEIDRFDFLRGVLYAGYKFNDRIVLNSEIEFEHASTETGGSASVEFAYLDFLLNRHAGLRTGLILVPAGLINEQHEPPTFLGSHRPLVETRIEPATWADTGAGLFGDAGAFSYRAFVLTGLDSSGFSASEALREGRQGGGQAKAQDLAFAARLDYRGIPGFLAGAFGYRGDSSQGAVAPTGFSVDPNGQSVQPPTRPFGARVDLYDLHAEYRARGVQLRALYAAGRLGDAKQVNDALGLAGPASVGSRFTGWYAEAGYDLLARSKQGRQALIPFVRYEAFDTQSRVPGARPNDPDPSPLVQPAPFAADPANDVRVWTWGAVYKPILNVSLKLDYQSFSNKAKTGVDQISFGLGYLF